MGENGRRIPKEDSTVFKTPKKTAPAMAVPPLGADRCFPQSLYCTSGVSRSASPTLLQRTKRHEGVDLLLEG